MKVYCLLTISAALAVVLGTGAGAGGHTVTQAELDAAGSCPARGMIDARTVCACNADAEPGSIWGSNPYTSDSAVCTAAQHADALEAGVGIVVLVPAGRQEAFPASTQNGVAASRWGVWESSFTVAPAQLMQAGTGEVCPKMIGAEQDMLNCVCPSGAPMRSVWGSGPYTADSDICSAARHAGVIGFDGGPVSVSTAEGQASYEGTPANGVDSRNWGSYGRSITFVGASAVVETTPQGGEALCGTIPSDAERWRCTCPANSTNGRVWGAGPYTSDSDICTAARHAGVVTDTGGPVTVLRIDGLDVYAESAEHGVTTSAWRQYGSSIVFDRNAGE